MDSSSVGNPGRIARRNLLTAGLGVAAACATAPSLAQQAPVIAPPRVKGPLVWLDMDQVDLDRAFDQAQYAPNIVQVTGRYASNSNAVRSRLGQPRHVAYGPTPIEVLDIYTTRRPKAPVQIFLHGGAWRGGLAKNYAFAADLFVQAGAHLVVPDFVWVQDAGGSLLPMADQVRRVVAWVHRNAASFGGDPDRIYISGHSSGAHLAGVALTTDWRRDFGLPADVLKGALCCSGLYDLKPVRLSARSSYVQISDDIEQALSTQRHLDRLNTPVIVAYGTLETPEFQRQSREFAAALQAAGKPVQALVGEGYNHFEIIETMANPYGLLGRAMLEQMKLTAG